MGNGLEIDGSGSFSYYIGIGIGGAGQWEEDSGRVTASVVPYESHGGDDAGFTLWLVADEGEEYLAMDSVNGEVMYWARKQQEEQVK